MHVVEVSTNGVTVGTIRFRGITPVAGKPSERQFKCTPKTFLPKSIVKRIADRLSAGSSAGNEDAYAWRT